jgi:hypothetical protein
MSKGHAILRFLRKIHLWIGVFTTPALLFFAITGAMQSFSLHETTQGSSYRPPAWIASLAELHKKQTTEVPPRRGRPGPAENAPGEERAGAPESGGSTGPAQPGSPKPVNPAGPRGPQKSHLPLKIFFLLVSISLVLSTLTGIYISYKYSHNWWVLSGLLTAGVVLPVLLLPF